MDAVTIEKTNYNVFRHSALTFKQKPSSKISEQDYWDNYYENEINYEWNNGILEEKGVSDYATILIYNWLVKLFSHYFETHNNGSMTNLEMGFRLNLDNKICIRKPDLGIVCQNNPIQLLSKDRSYHGIFDICIEAVSDSTAKEVIRDTVIKKQEYAQAGVKEYYLVYDKGCDDVKGIEVFRLEKGAYHPVKKNSDGLIKSTVLKGFQFRLEDCYHQPNAKKMCLDLAYQQFVFPEYHIEKNRADKVTQLFQLEKIRAETEKNRADNAEQQIMKLQALLAMK